MRRVCGCLCGIVWGCVAFGEYGSVCLGYGGIVDGFVELRGHLYVLSYLLGDDDVLV